MMYRGGNDPLITSDDQTTRRMLDPPDVREAIVKPPPHTPSHSPRPMIGRVGPDRCRGQWSHDATVSRAPVSVSSSVMCPASHSSSMSTQER